MRITKKLATVAFTMGMALAACSCTPSASAMVFIDQQSADGSYVVQMFGAIEPGDAAKLKAVRRSLRSHSAEAPLFTLIGSGGNVAEAIEVGKLFGPDDTIVIPRGKACSSACLLIFLRAGHKVVFSTSRLGKYLLHGVAGRLVANDDYSSAIVEFIQELHTLGVPDDVLGDLLKGDNYLSPGQVQRLGVTALP